MLAPADVGGHSSSASTAPVGRHDASSNSTEAPTDRRPSTWCRVVVFGYRHQALGAAGRRSRRCPPVHRASLRDEPSTPGDLEVIGDHLVSPLAVVRRALRRPPRASLHARPASGEPRQPEKRAHQGDALHAEEQIGAAGIFAIFAVSSAYPDLVPGSIRRAPAGRRPDRIRRGSADWTNTVPPSTRPARGSPSANAPTRGSARNRPAELAWSRIGLSAIVRL